MSDFLKFVWICVQLIAALVTFVYGAWQAGHGKWDQGAFWMALSVSCELGAYRSIDRIGKD